MTSPADHPTSPPGTGVSRPEDVVFRQATPADREGILAVSRHFENDWIGYVLEAWLAREKGGFLVAETGGEVVAVCAATLDPLAPAGVPPGYATSTSPEFGAWLSAMRVRPDCQNRGLATGLTRHILDACRAWGCRYARLSTAVTNKAVHHFIGDKLGFANLGRWIFQGGVNDWTPFGESDATVSGVRTASLDDLDTVWAFLGEGFRSGRIHPAGMVAPPDDPWRLVDFTRDRLAEHLGSGLCFVHEVDGSPNGVPPGAAAIDGLVLAASHPHDPVEPVRPGWSTISMVEGSSHVAAALLARALKAIHGDPAITEYDASLPESSWARLQAVTRPGWPSSPPALDAFIYHKELR
jgi:GNAT superfamily N-acetyltransferase